MLNEVVCDAEYKHIVITDKTSVIYRLLHFLITDLIAPTFHIVGVDGFP